MNTMLQHLQDTNTLNDLYEWLIPLGILIGSFLIGLIAEKVVSGQLSKLKSKAGPLAVVENAALSTIHGLPLLWCLLIGCYYALFKMHLPPTVFTQAHKIIQIIFMFSITVVLSRIVGNVVSTILQRFGAILPSTSIIENMTRLGIYSIGFLAILQTMGISVLPILTALLTALGIGGLAVSLALNDTLSNFFAGLQIIISRQIRPGDYIKMDTNQEGTVIDISLRNTTIRQNNNNTIIVPNLKLSSAIVTNFDKPTSQMLVSIPINIPQSDTLNMDDIEKITLDIAQEVMHSVQGGVPEFTPYIRYNSFLPGNADFNIYLKANSYTSQSLLKHEFIKRLKHRLKSLNETPQAVSPVK